MTPNNVELSKNSGTTRYQMNVQEIIPADYCLFSVLILILR